MVSWFVLGVYVGNSGKLDMLVLSTLDGFDFLFC